MDKIMSKRIWLSHGLPTPRFRSLESGSAPDAELEKVAQELGLPLMLKAPHEGSTIGIVKVTEAGKLRAGFDECARFDDVVLAEEFISGREITVPVLGRGRHARALPIVEIQAPEGNYDYQHKYFSDETKYLCPAPLDDATTSAIQAIAVRAFNALGCTGWARVDFMLRERAAGSDASIEALLLEINTSPGMTGHSLVPMAARAAGMSYEDLCVEILASARLGLGLVRDGSLK
jgi:D-alanine-D-alanine ligase